MALYYYIWESEGLLGDWNVPFLDPYVDPRRVCRGTGIW